MNWIHGWFIPLHYSAVDPTNYFKPLVINILQAVYVSSPTYLYFQCFYIAKQQILKNVGK